MGHAQNKKQFFFKNNKTIIGFQKRFILLKYHMFCLSYECFSVLYDGFFAIKMSFPAIITAV